MRFALITTLVFITCAAKGDHPRWKDSCRKLWGAECKHPVQSEIMTLGAATTNTNKPEMSCVRRYNAKDCTAPNPLATCVWCVNTIAPGTVERKCIVDSRNPAADLDDFCAGYYRKLKRFDYPKDFALNQDGCMKFSSDKDECESFEHNKCSYCKIPDVYGIKPHTGICHPKTFRNICEELNDVPRSKQNVQGRNNSAPNFLKMKVVFFSVILIASVCSH